MTSGFDGHASKRIKMDNAEEDPQNPSPSPVLHVRGLANNILEHDLGQAVQGFGKVSYITLMPKKHQALIEFEDIASATECVNYANQNQMYVAGKPAYFNYSTSQRIQRPGSYEDNKAANHILLFTIINPQYPITVDVMHSICSPYGRIVRTVIFKKNGVQAMVEFDSIDTAKRAKHALNGADIYSGCNTLKIDYAKTNKLNVFRNDNDSWDYTNPNFSQDAAPPRNQPLLADPRYPNAPAPYESQQGPGGPGPGYGRGPPGPNQGYPPSGPNWGQGGYGGNSGYGGGMYDQGDGYASGYGGMSRPGGYDMQQNRFSPMKQGPPQQMQQGQGFGRNMPPQGYQDQGPPQGPMAQGSVLMVYGLVGEQVNCDKLFNLFCLYGNVVRVKFLKSKEGSAMVQMGDAMAVERCMQNLNHLPLFGSEITLGVSKQAFLQDVHNPYELPDGTPSFKDFMGSRNNRFGNPEAASKNRIISPTKVLHYFNTPPGLTKELLNEVITKAGGKAFIKFKEFPSKSERSSSGLIQFESEEDAFDALVLANHSSIPNPAGKIPYVMKLCFSGRPISEKE